MNSSEVSTAGFGFDIASSCYLLQNIPFLSGDDEQVFHLSISIIQSKLRIEQQANNNKQNKTNVRKIR
jgi:hypothetical protein